ncbi:keratin, type I cytoskeletal 19 [Centroberyx affinis]|uniref:keratin, type I cytoskeletal 19 n=1 Tax=Centroberyx affinis TaxID=166261 RepID=UPI003A5C07B4
MSSLGSGIGFGGGVGAGAQFGFGGSRSGGSALRTGAGASGSAGMGGDGSLCVVGNEKMHMRSLNDRLAAYIEQVRMLEATNRELEQQLRSITFNKVVPHDLTKFDAQIKPLRQQLLAVILQHARISLEIDNAKLAADDFRLRWETELSMRQTVEGDIAGLRALQRDYDLANQAMMQDLQSLTEEYMALKKNHQQELLSVRGNLMGHIDVNVQAAESANLSQVLADIRAEYEAVVEHNRRQAEGWYIRQVEMKQVESAQLAETEVSETHEVTDGRKHSLVLQMELEALLMGNENLKGRLAEVEAQYQQRLLGMSGLVAGLEGELSSVHQGVTQQGQEYQRLLDIKSRLEMEINTYKQLLEGAAVVGAGMVSMPRGEVTMMASGGRAGASLIMKPRKISTSSTSSSAAAMMSSSGARGAAVMSTPGGGSTVIKTSKTVTITSSSSDTAGATGAAGAPMPTSRGAANISTTGAKMEAEAAMMSSAEAAGMPVRGGVVEGGMMMKSSHTEFSSSVESVVISGGETGAAGDFMKDGDVMMSSGDAMSSEGGTMSGEAMVKKCHLEVP